MKIFSILGDLFEPRGDESGHEEDALRWRRDPLSHPVIEAMSQRELADLPMPRLPGRGAGSDACRCG